ncbi:hypothetical protein HETIRDRAFT_386099, partial [Heterobasidion irregulare TC 32-1]
MTHECMNRDRQAMMRTIPPPPQPPHISKQAPRREGEDPSCPSNTSRVSTPELCAEEKETSTEPTYERFTRPLPLPNPARAAPARPSPRAPPPRGPTPPPRAALPTHSPPSAPTTPPTPDSADTSTHAPTPH